MPISSWGAYIIALIGGILAAHNVANLSAFSAFSAMIPLNFYALFTLLAVLVVVILQQLLSEDELRAWGWRIPFIGSICLLLVSLYIRLTMNESPAFKKMKEDDAFVAKLLFDGSLLLSGGVVYAVSYQGRVAGLDLESGRVLWQREVSSSVGVAQGFGKFGGKFVEAHEGSPLNDQDAK